MSRQTNQSRTERRRHDRSAVIQWVALAVVAGLGLLIAFVFAGDDGGTHVNAPPAETVTATH